MGLPGRMPLLDVRSVPFGQSQRDANSRLHTEKPAPPPGLDNWRVGLWREEANITGCLSEQSGTNLRVDCYSCRKICVRLH